MEEGVLEEWEAIDESLKAVYKETLGISSFGFSCFL